MLPDLPFLAEVMGRLLPGLPLTLLLAALSVAVGAVLALLLSLLRASSRAGAALVGTYVFVLRGSPLLVQLFLIYYGLSQFPAVRGSMLWPFLRQPFWCAVLALSLNTAAYASEIIRGGLRAVPPGPVEAARALGLSGVRLYGLVILPLALRQALPGYGNEVVIMVKALVGFRGGGEFVTPPGRR
jgi:octopine/nopaline transport system permease protein